MKKIALEYKDVHRKIYISTKMNDLIFEKNLTLVWTYTFYKLNKFPVYIYIERI
jgi:hypothetical protein